MRKHNKNKKLRRTVQRTISAIFMIMAVVVASIPVEHLGEMQASPIDGTVNLTNDASEYIKNNTLYDSKAEDDINKSYAEEVEVQHIDNNTFIDAYRVRYVSGVNGNEAMIYASTFKNDIASFDIYETEYYGYVQIDGTYVTDINNKFKDEKYQLKYGNDNKKTYEKKEVNIEVNTEGDETTTTNKTLTLEFSEVEIETIKTDGEPVYDKNTHVKNGEITALSSNPYKQIIELNEQQMKDYISGLYDVNGPLNYLYNERIDKISEYNKKIEDIISTLDDIKTRIDNDTVTEADETAWKGAVESYNNIKDDTLTTLEYSYDKARQMNNDSDGNGLNDIIDYTIQNRIINKDNNNTLKQFDLVQMTDLKGGSVWLPRRKNGETLSTQKVDGDDYLVAGSVTITGIGSGAFDTTNDKHEENRKGEVKNISIPSSVKFIGQGAFANIRSLESVSVDDSNLKQIGDKAFNNSQNLKNVTFSSSNSKLETIGVAAFYKTSVEKIVFPAYLKEIGGGCFFDSDIKSVTMGGHKDELTVGPYAFMDCAKLQEIVFSGEQTEYEIHKAAFALGNAKDGGVITDFAFPESMNSIIGADEESKEGYDYILAGRSTLNKVTMPGRMGNGVDEARRMIPDNTLAGCNNLGCVVFPDDAYYAEFNPKALFIGVTNDEFYVTGPATLGNTQNIATPRKLTWQATAGYTKDGGVVPYKYTDASGEHMEIGVGDVKRDDYIASIDMLSDTEARLSRYIENNGVNYNIAVKIPEKVGAYTIVEIAEGCFDDTVRNKIYKVVIPDGTVRTINQRAFAGCKSLQWVDIGNAVSHIGAEAFAECPKLENVVFSQTKVGLYEDGDDYWNELVMEDNAFKTGSDFLTFHGAIHPDYAPFKLAMSDEGVNMTGSSLQICYKTDAPTNLTVMRDNSTKKCTLIDYPHYEEIDLINSSLIDKWKGDVSVYSITGKFEEWEGLSGSKIYENLPYNTNTYYSEKDIPLYTMFMTLPKGIESIDSVSYYNNTANYSDLVYLNRRYTSKYETHDGKQIEVAIDGSNDAERNINKKYGGGKYTDVRKIYSDNSYIPSELQGEFGVVPGLFSGYMSESLGSNLATDGIIWKTYNNHDYAENLAIGNDYLTEINLTGVESLPDYAFLSCENLLGTSYGSNMSNIGALPYRNCKNLTQITIPADNPYYLFDNMILYRQNTGNGRAVSGLGIVQVLEGRGKASGLFKINDEADPNLSRVVSIDEAAFSYCDNITDADLGSTKITAIPNKCFYNAEKLASVVIPESTEVVGEEAFKGTGDNITLTVRNPECAIAESAFEFDRQTITIVGPKYDKTGTKQSAVYNYYLMMCQKHSGIKDVTFFFADEDQHRVTFVDYDLSTLEGPYYVEHESDVGASQGGSFTPTIPTRTGYKFKEWKCILPNGTLYQDTTYEPWQHVTEDRIVQAVYEPEPTIIVPTDETFTLTVNGGTANGKSGAIADVKGGDRFSIIPDAKTDGSEFMYWSVTPASYSYLFVDGVNTANTTFIMPNDNVTLEAKFSNPSNNGGGSGGNGGNGSGGNGSTSNDTKKKYKATVNYGSGSGEYEAGATVTIAAFAPDSASRVFSKWTSDSSSVGFVTPTSPNTTFIMPAADVTVTANYKTRTADDDEDSDSSSSRRPGTNGSQTQSSTSTTVTTRPNNSGSTQSTTGTVNTSGTTTGTNADNGNKIYITKNGVSNKDVASVSIDGSTDNFIVRISESDEATEAVKQALTNKYGTLEGLSYFPMDISLYDSTGQNKITDTYGLNITVTMPIPDVLIQYGGNSRVAAADNGVLQELSPRFTTIDGIACISFVPPHFSPYVIYVDTNNLTAGLSFDQTPATGDPIHPKWFLAIGLACISVIMFVTSDGRKRRVALTR